MHITQVMDSVHLHVAREDVSRYLGIYVSLPYLGNGCRTDCAEIWFVVTNTLAGVFPSIRRGYLHCTCARVHFFSVSLERLGELR